MADELELTLRELESIGKHLAKVHEVHKQNNEYENEIDLVIPLSIALNRVENGHTLGHVKYSDELEEYVFVPWSDKREAPKWANVPIPPPFN